MAEWPAFHGNQSGDVRIAPGGAIPVVTGALAAAQACRWLGGQRALSALLGRGGGRDHVGR